MNDLLRKAKQYFGNHNVKRKYLKKENFVLVILVGILLMVIQIPDRQSEKKEAGIEKMEEQGNYVDSDDALLDTYENQLEERTREILASIENAGDVSVMITFQDDGRQVVEKDKDYQTSSEHVADDAGGEKKSSTVQTSETTMYYTDEMDREVPFVNERYLPKVEGVLVVAEGGDNDYVNLQILRACQALFGIEAHKIVIVKGNACERRTE